MQINLSEYDTLFFLVKIFEIYWTVDQIHRGWIV